MEQPRRILDPSAGDWVLERLLDHSGRGVRVGSVVPTGFESVVRVLHPAGEGRTWAQVAAEAGRVVHPLVQWCGIDPDFTGGRSEVEPAEGSVPGETLGAILEHCPAAGEVTYALWHGFGSWEDVGDEETLMHGWGGRSYLLFAAPKAPLTSWPGLDQSLPQSANLIWPADRSWCLATEIDWDSTLVAGSQELAAAVLADPRLEAFSIQYDDDLSWPGDIVNPRPAWLDRLAAQPMPHHGLRALLDKLWS